MICIFMSLSDSSWKVLESIVLYYTALYCTVLYCLGLLSGLRDVERYINTVMAPALPRHLGPVSLVTLAPAQLEAVR